MKMLKRVRSLANRIIRPNIVSYYGCKLSMDPNLISAHIRSIIYKNSYELQEIEVLSQVLNPEDVILEIGGGMGFISVYCSKQIGSENVFTYEANPNMIPLIEKNCELNNVFPEVNNVILGGKQGETDFFIEDNFYSSSTVARSSTAKKITVKSLELSREVNRINPNFLIIDIEGGEIELIRELLLCDDNINKILIEVHPGIVGVEKINALVKSLLNDNYVIDTSIISKNVLFFHK